MGSCCTITNTKENSSVINNSNFISSKIIQNLSELKHSYRFIRPLSKGNLCLYENKKFPKKLYALKKIEISKLKGYEYSLFLNEIYKIKAFDNPFFCKYYDCFIDEEYFYIMMDYIEGVPLSDILSTSWFDKLPQKKAAIIFYYLTQALFLLHSRDLIHKNLTPENILFEDKNDFSSLKIVGLEFFIVSEKIKQKSSTDIFYYMPPEIVNNSFNKKHLSSAIDIWSLGMILFYMSCGSYPYDKQEKYKGFNINEILLFEYELNKDSKEIIKRSLKMNQSERCDIKLIIQNTWLQSSRNIIINGQKPENIEEMASNILKFQKFNTLKKVVYFCLVHRIKIKQQLYQRIKTLFLRVDDTNKGYLDKESFLKNINLISLKDISQVEALKYWEGLSFHYNKIFFSDFLTVFLTEKISKKITKNEEKLIKVYDYFDFKQFGFITFENIVTVLNKFNSASANLITVAYLNEPKRKSLIMHYQEFKEELEKN